jgi:hypothetical protein
MGQMTAHHIPDDSNLHGKEVAIANFSAFSWHLPGGNEED